MKASSTGPSLRGRASNAPTRTLSEPADRAAGQAEACPPWLEESDTLPPSAPDPIFSTIHEFPPRGDPLDGALIQGTRARNLAFVKTLPKPLTKTDRRAAAPPQ